MALARVTYGKGRVRVMRVDRGADRHEVRELELRVMLEGDFFDAFLSPDNSKVVATDSIKNIVNFLARDHVGLETEAFLPVVAGYFLQHYGQVERVSVEARETRWARMVVDGVPHEHAFLLDANGRPVVRLEATRDGAKIVSGVEGYNFLKTTGSGWVGYVIDEATTLPETEDRIFATSMNACWVWAGVPGDYGVANAAILAAMMKVFATEYSPSVQHSLYGMANAALAAVPEIAEISLACPNKHYIPINLAPFKRDNPKAVFLPTDEPHGQIECVVVR